MTTLFADGTLITLILAGMLAEAALLVAYHRVTGRGIAPSRFLLNLCSGMGLLLAMRLLLAGAWWGWTSLSLLAALAFHVGDLVRLWSIRPVSGPVPMPGVDASGRRGKKC